MRQALITTAFLVIITIIGGCSGTPDSNQIKADLIGQSMRDISTSQGWFFESPSEFKEFTINNKHKKGKLLEYNITMLLQELKTGKQFRAQALIIYRKEGSEWQLINIVSQSLQEIK